MKRIFIVCWLLLCGPALANIAETTALPEQAILVQSININQADATTLAKGLKGIGKHKAQAIIQYRSEHGPFDQVEDLLQVKGIGAELLAKNRERITL
ncbi:ComEA family DNA-binding protein [Ferrimonas pelagia]|uniref:ComEA family DNA-binding protein n=1 Tax=Ferrimonas pelagia TaxID=1177826 RepID=A0ABP9ELB9_9GAMM